MQAQMKEFVFENFNQSQAQAFVFVGNIRPCKADKKNK